jgi:hypothetical protein
MHVINQHVMMSTRAVAGVGPTAAAAGCQCCGCWKRRPVRRCRSASDAVHARTGGPVEPTHARQVRTSRDVFRIWQYVDCSIAGLFTRFLSHW